MTRPPLRRAGLILALAVALGAAAFAWLAPSPPAPSAAFPVGGPFTLTSHRGERLTEAAFRGRPAAFFFGFTHCPDVCPTTLLQMGQRLAALGPAGDRLAVAFVTVDPDRDTPEQLALYLSSFDPRITGLTGTPAEIEAVSRAFRVYARRVPLETGGYTMDHTATVYLMAADGQLAATLGHGEAEDAVMGKLSRIVGQ